MLKKPFAPGELYRRIFSQGLQAELTTVAFAAQLTPVCGFETIRRKRRHTTEQLS
jgi:hypothetical protein